jgi:hypothetical protein
MDMGLAVPKRPHALLFGVSRMRAEMSATLASAACELREALAQPEAVRGVFYGVDAAFWHIDHQMHGFFADAKAGQLAQAVVLERAAEQGACARVTSWLQAGGAVLPSIVEAKYELEHASRTLHRLLAEYHALCCRLHGHTDAFWRAYYDEVPSLPACMSPSGALKLACACASSRCSA